MEAFWPKRSKFASFAADRSSGVELVSPEPAFREGSRWAQKQGTFSKLSSDSSFWSSGTTNKDSIPSGYRERHSKQPIRTPIKKLLAEEMLREAESKRRSPSVIARLMGLDGLPPQQHGNKQQKRSSEKHQKSTTLVETAERSTKSYGRQSSRNSSKEEQEFKDVFEVLETSKTESSCYETQGTGNSKLTEAEVAFIRQKFMDAKRLSTDEKLQDSKEFQDALEVLDSNKDLLLKFLQQPDSLFLKHLHDLQAVQSQSHCDHMSTMKPSHPPKYADSGLGQKTEKESRWKNHNRSSWKHPDGLSNQLCSTNGAQASLKSPKIQLEGKIDSPLLCTRIVVLKPNLGKVDNTTRKVSSPCSSHAFLSDFRKHGEPPGFKIREPELWERRNFPKDMGLSHKSRESREIAKEITRKMKNSFNGGSMNFPPSTFRGYIGDESSCDMVESDSANESGVRRVTSRDNFHQNERYRPSSSRTAESSVSREAKKRLSERWKMTHRSQEMGVISRASTLGEMLAIPDKVLGPANLPARRDSEKFGISDGGVGLDEPLGISSREGWKDGCVRNLSRSRSLPSSSAAFGSPRGSICHEALRDDRYIKSKDAVKQESIKSGKGKIDKREGQFSRNSRSRSKKSQSSKCTSGKSNDISPEFHLCRHQGKSNYEEENLCEDMVSCTSTSIISDTRSLPEIISDVGHEDKSTSSKAPVPELSAPMLATAMSSDIDLDISNAQEPSEKPSSEVSLHHPVPDIESPASCKEGDQPSPVSTLEAPFIDDLSTGSECFESLSADLHGLRLQLQLLKLESEVHEEGHILISSDDEADKGSAGSADDKGMFRGEDNWELLYIADVLLESGLNNVNRDKFMSIWNTSECPVNPLVFEHLEKKYNNLSYQSRSERKLIFDGINSKVEEMYQQLKDPHPWVRLTKTCGPVRSKNGFKDGLPMLLCNQDKKMNTDVLAKVLVSESQWLDLGDEVDIIGREVERLLIDDLVSEVIVSM